MRKALGQTIRQLRERMKLTQEALAGALGVVRHTVGRWERGHHIPSDSIIQRLPEALGVTVEEFEAEFERQFAIALRKKEAPPPASPEPDDYPPIGGLPGEIADSRSTGGRWIRVFVPSEYLENQRR